MNQFAGRSSVFDYLVVGLANHHLFKGALMVAACWWVWGLRGDDLVDRREQVVLTVAGALLAVLVARWLNAVLPMRLRPIDDPAAAFHLPLHATRDWLSGHSAMPSDHAAYFAALAAGLWAVSPPLGLLAAGYVVVVVLLPRLYLGYHWASDLLWGTALGVSAAALVRRAGLRRVLAGPLVRWLEARPGLGAALLFLLGYELASLFDDLRWLGAVLWNAGAPRGG